MFHFIIPRTSTKQMIFKIPKEQPKNLNCITEKYLPNTKEGSPE